MPNVDNLTPFAAISLLSMTRRDEESLTVLVAGRFDLPAAGRPAPRALTISEKQQPPPMEDIYWGEPGLSSLRYEGQTSYVRPGTDIYLNGHAWAPRGRPCRHSQIELRVGPCQRVAVVYGDRVWQRGLLGVTTSSPEPFVKIPLQYERCFGGSPTSASISTVQAAERNPVGVGLFERSGEAVGHPLPNFENPNALLRSVGDRPLPQGFGPVCRSWLPRRTFGGTYDAEWVQSRAPLWPADFDERFFCAASPGLCAVPHLRGGEPVYLAGVSPDGPLSFALPSVQLQAKFRVAGRIERRLMLLDGVLLEPDKGVLTMLWRTHQVAQGELLDHAPVVLRELHDWESTGT
jgi:hypothetical protein